MRVTGTSIALTVASLLAAGALGQVNQPGEETHHDRYAAVGERITVDKGHTFAVTRVSYGQYAVNPEWQDKAAISPARFIAVELELTTQARKTQHAINCTLVSADGVATPPVQESASYWPEPGFRRFTTVLFESSRGRLADATVTCAISDVITFYEPRMNVPLGVTDASLDQTWTQSAHRKVVWTPDSLQVVR